MGQGYLTPRILCHQGLGILPGTLPYSRIADVANCCMTPELLKVIRTKDLAHKAHTLVPD